MEIYLYFGHHLEFSEEKSEYIKKKISKLQTFNKKIMAAHVNIDAGKEHNSESKFRVAVNLHLPPKHILRAVGKGRTITEATDLVSEELERQVEKHAHYKELTLKERKQRKIKGQYEEPIEE